MRLQTFIVKGPNALPLSWKQFKNCPFQESRILVNMESSDSICKLKNFATRHEKNVEKSFAVLQNVSFIQPMKFVLLLQIEKKN